MNNQPRSLTPAQIDTMAKFAAKHAEERARLEGAQHNARVELLERHRAELAAAAAPPAPEAPPAS